MGGVQRITWAEMLIPCVPATLYLACNSHTPLYDRVAGHARFWQPFEGLALLTAKLLDAKEEEAMVG